MSEIAAPPAATTAPITPTAEVPSKPVAIEAPASGSVSGKPVHRYGHENSGGLTDVMHGDARREIKVLDHGFVALVDAMPRLVPTGQTADQAIVQAARVSYGQGTKKVSEDRGLIRYLLRHRHTTPFEMVEFKFHISMPIFIVRQWIRHRTANVNEYSGRYSVMPDKFYRPTLDQIRKQSAANRQGGEQRFDVSGANTDDAATAEAFDQFLADSEKLYERYIGLTEKGVSRELVHWSTRQPLHPVVLEDRPAQPAPLPLTPHGQPRAGGDPAVRPRDVRPRPADRPGDDGSVARLHA
ncbi:MAG: FAD-dependent thymidylate synthase [Phycisphaerales bacterium]